MTGEPERQGSGTPFLPALAYLAFAVSAILLLLVRLQSVWTTRGMLDTSGVEGAGMRAVQIVCQGAAIYDRMPSDPNPYVFNWLFYLVYPAFAGIVTNCSENTLLAARLLTLAFCIGAGIFLFAYARRRGSNWIIATAVALAPVTPATGWWAFAVRPDIGGFFLATLAFAAAWSAATSHDKKHRLAIAALAISLGSLAWGFKQPYAVVPAAIALYLSLTARDWAERMIIILFSGGVAAACAFVVLSNDNMFLHTIVFPQNRWFVPDLMARNVGGFLIKILPFLILATAVIWGRWKSMNAGLAIQLHEWLFVAMMLGVGAVFSIASGFYGAGDSYLFGFFAAFLVFLAAFGSCAADTRLDRMAAVASGVAGAMLCALYLSGIVGRPTLEDRDAAIVAPFITDLRNSPHPQLVMDDNLARPQNSPGADVRVLDYDLYRLGPKLSARGPGLHDRIAKGEFATIVIEDRFAYDIDLSHYVKMNDYGRISLYVRRSPQLPSHGTPGDTQTGSHQPEAEGLASSGRTSAEPEE